MKKRAKNKNRSNGGPKLPLTWLRNFVIFILICFIAVMVYRQVIRIFMNSEYFAIRDIAVDSSLEFLNTAELASLKGKNLFAVNLDAAQKKLQYKYPEISQLKISRRFPDQLLVTAHRRIPMAQIEIKNKQVFLDEDGVILPFTAGEGLELPTIIGVNTEKWSPTPGTQVRGRDLHAALRIIEAFRGEEGLSSYRIRKLDVNNFSKITFYISDKLQIIIDRDKISTRMKMLALVLSQTTENMDTVRYIDLRFQQPILGKK